MISTLGVTPFLVMGMLASGFIVQENGVKYKAPIDDRLLEFKFPEIQERILDNGLTLLFIEHHELPKIYLRLGIDFGEKNAPEGREGAVELMARVLKKGTENRTYEQIVEEIDFVGGSLDIRSTQDFFYVYGEFLKEYADIGMEALSDVVMNPLFPEEEIEKERARMLANLENEKSSPAFLAHRRLKKMLFHPHPYAQYKSPQSLREIDRSTLQSIHRNFFVPGKTFLVIAGDISLDQALDKAQNYFRSWPTRETKRVKFPLPPPRKTRTIHLVDRPGSEQSNILLANLLFSRKNPQYEKMVVMNKILGGGASGRLFMYLREKKGYTYGAYSSLQAYKETGIWVANAEVRTEATADALSAFFEELRRMQIEPVPEEELKNARRYLIGVFPLQNETPADIASLALQQKLYDLPEDYWEHYLANINTVTAEEVQAMAKQYLNNGQMAIVIVGDMKRIEGRLRQFGPIEIYDPEDHRIR